MKINYVSLTLVILFLFGISNLSNSQDNLKQPPVQNPQYYNWNIDGGVEGADLRLEQPPPQTFSPEKTEILQKLRNARKTGNTNEAKYYWEQLCRIDNRVDVPAIEDGRFTGYSPLVPFKDVQEPDFNSSNINDLGSWSNAVATVPVGAPGAGTIYVATAHYRPAPGGDTIKLYRSLNGGVTWSYVSLMQANFNMDYNNNEMDLEICYDGSVVWIYIVAAYTDFTDANRRKIILFRYNVSTLAWSFAPLAFPGSTTAGNQYYNPRITSDNTNYTSAAYVYIFVCLDSLYSSTVHYARQKLCLITNPYAGAMTLNYTQPGSSGGWPWFYGSGDAARYNYIDIGFYFNGTDDRIMTIANFFPASDDDNHLAWSNDYGATIGGTLELTETKPTRGSKLAFNGGASNQNGMVITLERFSASGDWDTKHYYTSTGGTTGGSWASGYLDFTSQNSSGTPDLVGIRNVAGQFRAAYTKDSSGVKVFYGSWNGSAWAPNRIYVGINPDTTWAQPRAGYRNGGGDDCLTIWRSMTTLWTQASYLCQTTVGVTGNEIPVSFKLYQNYPNPFNPSTSINFDLPVSGLVKLTIYDVTGKEIAVLINDNLNAGSHSYSFDASALSSGVYFYKINTNSFSDVKKMMLVK